MEGEGVRGVASGEYREDFGGTHGPVQDLGVDRYSSLSMDSKLYNVRGSR